MMHRPQLSKSPSSASSVSQGGLVDSTQAQAVNQSLLVPGDASQSAGVDTTDAVMDAEDQYFNDFSVPLKMKNLEKWESKHNPVLYVRAKYMPYAALRQQFWRALLKQYDADESGLISRAELTTMLDTLGSTLKESTIDSFFQRFPHKAADNEDTWDLTMDEAVICLEDQLEKRSKPSATIPEKLKHLAPDVKGFFSAPNRSADSDTTETPDRSGTSTPFMPTDAQVSSITVSGLNTPNEDDDSTDKDEPSDRSEEHVVEIKECPICHQPRLNKRRDADIVTHIATCASQDWRQVSNVLIGGFVTASQAQRKWYSKVITKLSYGGYKLGANSANILVQDRITGQITEEKMSVYVRLGIRLLYKGLKSRDMENKRSKFNFTRCLRTSRHRF
jgi:phosphatidylserine decarboxylase